MKVSEEISKRTPSLKESVTRTNRRLSTDDEVKNSIVSSRKVDNLASSKNKTECKLTSLKIVYFKFIETMYSKIVASYCHYLYKNLLYPLHTIIVQGVVVTPDWLVRSGLLVRPLGSRSGSLVLLLGSRCCWSRLVNRSFCFRLKI